MGVLVRSLKFFTIILALVLALESIITLFHVTTRPYSISVKEYKIVPITSDGQYIARSAGDNVVLSDNRRYIGLPRDITVLYSNSREPIYKRIKITARNITGNSYEHTARTVYTDTLVLPATISDINELYKTVVLQ